MAGRLRIRISRADARSSANLASLMGMLWLFFENVDVIRDAARPTYGLILARRPRRKLKTADLFKPPKVLQGRSFTAGQKG